MTATPTAQRTSDEEHFAFGENWRRFLEHIGPSRIAEAERSLEALLGRGALQGARILDVGCGSGLFSLAALRLGAASIRSIDYDPQSVDCTAELRRRFGADANDWIIERGDATDTQAMRALGTFDIVYAWGVLHHTGAMWLAIDNASQAVAPGGQFVLSIYNDQGLTSRLWTIVKRTYQRLPRPLRMPYVVAVMLPRELRFLLGSMLARKPMRYLHSWTQYETNRGMSRWHDLVDWVGGWPFEVAKPEEVFTFCRDRGFVLEGLSTAAGGLGCNEFTFRRPH